MMLNHWKGQTIDFLGEHLPSAKRQIRIATGFFTVEGYSLIRPYVAGKTVKVMVGYDASCDGGNCKLIDDIIAHLTGWTEANRHEVVLDLVGKLQRGEFLLAKQATAAVKNTRNVRVHIIDDNSVLLGSGNLTADGLLYNSENLSSVVKPSQVVAWCNQFENYWNASGTQDLTKALLAALLTWLKLSIPYDVYLKTIQALLPNDETTNQRISYKQPVEFQKVVIERILRQLKELRGSILVASTGLGKTIMGTHTAFRLYHGGEITKAIVFAPVQVHGEWTRSFKDVGVPVVVLTRNLLDQPRKGNGKAIRQLEDALLDCDSKTLIVIDETQYFVNRLRSDGLGDRRSFERIVEIVHPRQAYVLLLTATPMVKAAEDLNSQLYLLPHTAPADITNPNGQMYLLPPDKHIEGRYPWGIRTEDKFFEEFIDLPVVTVISTSYVAKTFAVHTDQGDYLEFGSSRQWIPKIELRKISVPLPVEKEISDVIEKGFFKHKRQSFQHRGGWMQTETTIQKEVLIAWTSSPKALIDILRDTIDDNYNVNFIKSIAERRTVLQPILTQLESLNYEQDAKFMALCECLKTARKEGRKVIVFSERLATCVYLEMGLATLMPEVQVANAVQALENEYALKDAETVDDLILDFAPEANSGRISKIRRSQSYDVFITTDAYGVGVNLQDASIVISYDIAWTPDTIIQRAGRILRFWKEPRKVQLYIFVGAYQEHKPGYEASLNVETRMERLAERSRHAERFTEITMIPDGDRVEFPSLASLSVVSLGELEVGDIEEFSGISGFLTHVTERNQNLEYANGIPDGINSAMAYRGKQHQLYLLLRYRKEYHWMLYDIAKEHWRDIKEDSLLSFIQCTKETSIANVSADLIEEYAQKCRILWCAENNIEKPEEVEQVCALYLKPRTDESNAPG
jgi:superfamily II DNA or RNA helicase